MGVSHEKLHIFATFGHGEAMQGDAGPGWGSLLVLGDGATERPVVVFSEAKRNRIWLVVWIFSYDSMFFHIFLEHF